MSKLTYTAKQKRKASTLLSLALSELKAASQLLHGESYRESVTHLYFTSFYASQSLLQGRIQSDSHKAVESQIHKSFKDRGIPPQRYVKLHSELHRLRTRISYRDTEIPNPRGLRTLLGRLRQYFEYVGRIVPRTEFMDILTDLRADHPEIAELSFELFLPLEYGYGGERPRLTLWVPGDQIGDITPRQLAARGQKFLEDIGADHDHRYVVGINSRVDQIEAVHLILLDLDTADPAVESALKDVGGFLFRSGRGFHFVGRTPVKGQRQWEMRMRSLARSLKPHVDTEHIRLSIARGYATLRLTTNVEKPHPPTSVRFICCLPPVRSVLTVVSGVSGVSTI